MNKTEEKDQTIDMTSWTFNKRSLIVLAAFMLPLYILAFYFDYRIYDIPLFQRSIKEDLRMRNGTKRILFWNTLFGEESFYLGKGDIFLRCPVNDCYATHDRHYADLLDFDAILFHGNELQLEDLPPKRSPRQWYVFVNLESPINRPLVSDFYEDFFNLTMTYRLDSDVAWPYGTIRNLTTDRVVAPLPNTTWTTFYNLTGNLTDSSRRGSEQNRYKFAQMERCIQLRGMATQLQGLE